MKSIESSGQGELRRARAAVDGALSRDRGRLLGLWSRWSGKPGDAALQAAFAEALEVKGYLVYAACGDGVTLSRAVMGCHWIFLPELNLQGD